ncbi:MAG: GTPase Era [Spirochaetaceae bacterium]|nr:GTPase Era [Spirochaetaceae bacterium]
MNGAEPARADLMRVSTIGVVGRPSTGKSSLINRICGHKVSIVSPVPQTTRSRVRGIATLPAGQLIFLDTPGLHVSDRKLNLVLKTVALSVADEVDLLLLLFDSTRPFGPEDDAVLASTRRFAGTRVAACNKVDLAGPRGAQEREARLRRAGIDDIRSVSARTGAGVPALVERLLELSPVGDLLYPDDMYTDQSPDFRVAEIVREHAFARVTAEVPHALYVDVIDLEQRTGALWIRATIWVERPSQVGIVVGRGGAGIAAIRRDATAELARIFGRRIHLDLRVKVRKKWRRNDALLQQLRLRG